MEQWCDDGPPQSPALSWQIANYQTSKHIPTSSFSIDYQYEIALAHNVFCLFESHEHACVINSITYLHW
jgi:hypothetical protein